MNTYNKLKEINPNVTIFPNTLPITDFKPNVDKLRIGYMGGNSHKEDLSMLQGLNVDLYRKFGNNYELYIAGYSGDDTYLNILSNNGECLENIKLIPNLPIEQFLEAYKLINIAIAPLQDTEFNYSKSNLKFIEAAAYSIPLIASRVTPYINIPCNYADSKDKFLQVIESYIKDLKKLDYMGDIVKRYVSLHYNFDEIIKNRFYYLNNLK